jgi:hypothetical protein
MTKSSLISSLGLVVALAVAAVTASAQGLPGATVRKDDAAPVRAAGKGDMRARCQENPQECERMKAEFEKRREDCKAAPEKCRAERKARQEERCKANPQQCEEVRKKMQERREQCKAEPEKCRAEMKARQTERCKADPKRCEEMKARIEQRRAECAANPERCKPAAGSRPGPN